MVRIDADERPSMLPTVVVGLLAAATVGSVTMIVPAVRVVCDCVHDTLGESSNRGSAARSSAATLEHVPRTGEPARSGTVTVLDVGAPASGCW